MQQKECEPAGIIIWVIWRYLYNYRYPLKIVKNLHSKMVNWSDYFIKFS